MKNIHDLFDNWQKSDYSGGGQGSQGGCLEYASNAVAVGIRDTKQWRMSPATRPALLVTHEAWARFRDGAISNNFTA